MKKIILALLVLSFSVFSNENTDEQVLSNEEVVVVEGLERNEVVEVKDKLETEEESTGRFIRVKAVGGIEGKARGKDNGGKKTLWDRDEDFELILEGVYRVDDTYEVAVGTGVQKFGEFLNEYEGHYAVPFYASVKRNFFKGPIYVKVLGGMAFNFETSGTKQFYADLATAEGFAGITKNDIELENGYYYGAGIGMDLGNLEIEALYTVNEVEGKFDQDGTTYYVKFDNNRISLAVSYAFEVK